MNTYPFRYDWLFLLTRSIQNIMDVSGIVILGVNLDLIFHLLLPIVLYLLLRCFFKLKTTLLILFILITAKELNDFYVFYWFKDLKLKYIHSCIRDYAISLSGTLLVHFSFEYLIKPRILISLKKLIQKK